MLVIDVNGTSLLIPSSSQDTDWAYRSVVFFSMVAQAINTALADAGTSIGGQNYARGEVELVSPSGIVGLPITTATGTLKLSGVLSDMSGATPEIEAGVEGQEILIYSLEPLGATLWSDGAYASNVFLSSPYFYVRDRNSLRLRFLGGSWYEVDRSEIHPGDGGG
jgi:hypothetical protein